MKNAIAILALVVAWSTAFSQDVVKLKAKDLEAGQIVIADTMANGVIRFVTRQLSAALAEAGFSKDLEHTMYLRQRRRKLFE